MSSTSADCFGTKGLRIMADTTVFVVGGGFAGVACAKALAKQQVKLLLIDENNYHQFQLLLYQVATAQIAAYDIAGRCAGSSGTTRRSTWTGPRSSRLTRTSAR